MRFSRTHWVGLCAAGVLSVSGAALAEQHESEQGAMQPAAEAGVETEIYLAALQPLNIETNGRPATGAAVFVRKGDELTGYVKMAGLEPGMMHRQMLHVGNRCPTAEADENNDQVVDVIEGVPSYGLVLVPLDDNLTEIAEGNFPSTGSDEETLEYAEVAAFEELQKNVSGEDTNPDDPVVKLKPDQKLDLAGMTVVIHGVSEDKQLPESVQGVADVAPHLTVPVACGVIEKLEQVSG